MKMNHSLRKMVLKAIEYGKATFLCFIDRIEAFPKPEDQQVEQLRWSRSWISTQNEMCDSGGKEQVVGL